MLSGRRKLLLADDSPTIQKVISLIFGDEGMEVVAVGDGAGALRALEEEPPPDVLLADVVMPGPDGYELCERVKRDGRLRHVPVVLLVGSFEPFNEAEARRVGADTVLTKPFQSIRDLVSKVGSLLGGGEPKEDEAARDERETRAAPAAEPPTAARAEAPARPAETPAGAPFGTAGEARGADPASSFADLGADDELIEARPADAFGAPAAAAPPRAERAHAFAESHEPSFLAAPPPEANGNTAPSLFGADELTAGGAADRDEVLDTYETEERLTEQTEESMMREDTSPQPSFDSRATGAAAADDALLDLGQVETHATASAAEADDFVLDLDFDDEPAPVAAHAAAPEVFASEAFARDEGRPSPPVWADAPSAFAEAAHGDEPRPFAEAAASFDRQPAAFADSASSTARAEPEAWAEPSAPAAEHEAPWRDVVLQDGPQGFAFGAQAQGAEVAPRGFVEPEVVPAEEPVPAVVESEFTDGSVEGDLPRPPAAEVSAGSAHGAHAHAAASAHDSAPQEPSTAGYAVGEARAGTEEPLGAEQFSPEMIDAIARRVVELMSERVVREIAWEVVPELAELVIRQRLDQERQQ